MSGDGILLNSFNRSYLIDTDNTDPARKMLHEYIDKIIDDPKNGHLTVAVVSTHVDGDRSRLEQFNFSGDSLSGFDHELNTFAIDSKANNGYEFDLNQLYLQMTDGVWIHTDKNENTLYVEQGSHGDVIFKQQLEDKE